MAALTVLLLAALWGEQPSMGAQEDYVAKFEISSVAQVAIDAEGRHLRFPSVLAFDRASDELYVFTGGRSQGIIYGADFYPLTAMSRGRGVETPQGSFVGTNGLIYLCQVATKEKGARVTVFNRANIPVKEIFFDKLPDTTAAFVPRRIVAARNGTLYVASWDYPGVAVLDEDGTFLRWLNAMDKVSTLPARGSTKAVEGDPPPAGEPGLAGGQDGQAPSADIPAEFLPRGGRGKGEGPEEGLSPVYIRSLSIDSEGNLYLVSGQTSKTYVFGPDEKFQFSFGEKGGTPGKLSQPRGLGIDEKKQLFYVVDYMRHSILVYDKKGKWLFEFGGKGDAPGWFNFPSDIVVDNKGQLIVADLFNHRVQVLDLMILRK